MEPSLADSADAEAKTYVPPIRVPSPIRARDQRLLKDSDLELGLLRLEKAAHTGDALIEQMVESVFCEEPVRLREAA